jgi:hypothetical protein
VKSHPASDVPSPFLFFFQRLAKEKIVPSLLQIISMDLDSKKMGESMK